MKNFFKNFLYSKKYFFKHFSTIHEKNVSMKQLDHFLKKSDRKQLFFGTMKQVNQFLKKSDRK